MLEKIKKVIKLYKNWIFSILKGLFFICLLTIGFIVVLLSAPFITSTKVQRFLENMIDKILRLLI